MAKEQRKTLLEITLTNLEHELRAIGALPEGEHLIYEKGSVTNGVSRQLWQGRRGSLCPYVPRWSLKTTQSEAIAQMGAIAHALFALRVERDSK